MGMLGYHGECVQEPGGAGHLYERVETARNAARKSDQETAEANLYWRRQGIEIAAKGPVDRTADDGRH